VIFYDSTNSRSTMKSLSIAGRQQKKPSSLKEN
jgi:hypothetical protein